MIDTINKMTKHEIEALLNRENYHIDVVQYIVWLRDEIDRLNAELEKYRWHPYPQEKPECGMWQVTTISNMIQEFYWSGNDHANMDLWKIVIAYRPMPEAYKTEEEK